MSAFTVTSEVSGDLGTNGKWVTLTLTGPSSYDTGGSVINLTSYFPTAVHNAVVSCETNRYGGGCNFKVVSLAASLIFVADSSAADGGDEVASTTDLSSHVFRITAFGR